MLTRLTRLLRSFRGDRRGNVAMITAFALPVMVGSVGLGAEVTSWYNAQRGLQNAADSAAMAAATSGGANFVAEAKAVAAKYGFTDGQNGVTVEATGNLACPAGGTGCYRVRVSKLQPLLLAQVVGFTGDATTSDGKSAKMLQASAMALKADSPRDYCILALVSSGVTDGIRANGSPDADLTGCKIVSNTNSNCNGHSLKADYSDAHLTSANCGERNTSNVSIVSDPYFARAANIPANPCSSYSWIPSKRTDAALAVANKLAGNDTRKLIKICGDAQLTGDTTLSGGDTVLVVYGGRLDVGSYTLKTAQGSSVTIIFAGPTNGTHMHIPTGIGKFDIQAPKTGDWRGISIYQAPDLTTNVDVLEAGNAPAWKITGMVYLPHASVTFSGIVNKASYGDSCFGMVVDNLLVNGTAEILAHGECPRAGLILPTLMMPGRGQLVS